MLLFVAGVEIADDGTFLFREAVRINFGHLVAQQFNGDLVNVSPGLHCPCACPWCSYAAWLRMCSSLWL
jgi:hypothetical protein